jgi:hypothetical protein
MNEWVWVVGEMLLTGESEVLGGGNPVPVLHCPTQILHGLT